MGYDAYSNLDKEMNARTLTFDAKSNLKMTWDWLEMKFVDSQWTTFKIKNALMYHILLKIFMNTDVYVYMKWMKIAHYGQALLFDIHQWFLSHARCMS